MSGRPQGRGRQVRRDRSQPKRVRDHSADSVGSSTSTQSERDREHRNGRNSRRRPEKNNDRGRRRNDENRRDVSERDNVKGNAVENKEKPKQRSESEKQPPRGREANRDASRDLNPECSVSKAATNDRNNMFGDDSRLSHIIKRITKESDRDRRLTAAQQLEEFLNSPDNYQMIDKYAENLFTVLEDVLFERGLPELKEKVANCIGLIGGNLGNEAGRFFQWIFSKLESSITDEVKIPLLLSLGKVNLKILDTVDILVGWHIDTSQQNSLTSYTSVICVTCTQQLERPEKFLVKFHGVVILFYMQELGMLSNQVVTSDEIPSPYVSLPRLTALVRVFTTVVNGIGPSFSPNRSPSITPPYLTELIQRIIQCINMSGYSYYYEKLFVSANQCLESMCSWLQPYFSCCCEITASFVIQQLSSTSCVTYTHIMSALQLVQKVVAHVNTAIPQSFIQQLLEPGSPVMKLRTSSDEAVLSSVMKIYQGFLGIHDVPLLDTAYKIAVTELTSSFNALKKMLQVNVNSDNQFETLSDINNCKAASSDGEGVGDGATDPDKSASETSLASFRSSYELETIIIFDLCALSEIATSKSAILRLWKLSPSPFQLLTQHLDACEWTIAVCHPSIQYTILHALYTYCQRYNHFLPNSQSEGIRVSPDGDMVSMFSLLSNVLRNSSTSQDSRKLCLVWLFEILDKAVTTGVLPLVSKNISLDSIALSILPSTFDHDPSMSVEISLCLKILIEMKVLSKKCLKKFYKDCSIRLMDVDKDVRRSYQELIKALPTDLLTSSLNQILFESRITKESGTVAVGNPLATSCNDVWLARKGHAIKPPIGSFHSHDFQIVMGFILSGNFPSKEINVDWLTRLFHSCNRVQRYSETEMVQFDRCESLLWFWATWEVAQFCILSRLRTPLGRAQETFQAIEGKFGGSKPYLNHLQCVLLVQFIENLEKLMYNGYEGCVVGLPSPPKSVRVFFRTNRGTCLEWLSRVRKPVMSVGSACGSPAATVWHGFQTLQEMKKGENTQGEEFDTAVLQTAQALSELKSAHAISGLKAWCEQVTGRKFSWTNGIVMKAKGWYESSAAEYKSTLEEAFKMEAKKSHQEEQKAKDASSPSNAVIAFLVNETTDCYMKLSSWNEVLEWQKHLANLRKHCSDIDAHHSLMPNVDMNYVKALSKFEDCNFTSIHDHLRLIPGAALNSLTENLTKSAWSVKLNHPDATFTPVWAPDKIEQTAMLSLIQAETLFFTSGTRTKTKDNNTKEQKIIQAVKACIHHSASLCESVLRVGGFSWPVDVSASHIAQLQFAAAVKNILDTEVQQDELSPSFLQGNGTFTVDHTQHDTFKWFLYVQGENIIRLHLTNNTKIIVTSSMGNVDLLPKEKETVLQNLPQAAKPAEVESVLLVLGQVHVGAYFNQEEDIGEEDQVYDDGVESTKKQLLTVCPGLQDAQPQLLDKLLSVWTGVRDRLFKHYHFAAKAYFMYLRMGAENCDKSSTAFNNEPVTCQTSKSSDDDSNVTATLRLLRLVVKHAGELRSELEEGLVTTPTRPWKDITPQLFSRLNHPENYVRQSVSELLCRIGQDAPHLIVYPAVVGCSTSLPKYLLNKGKEGEGLLPLLVSHSSNTSSEDTLMQGSQSSETPNKPESDALASCYQIIVDSIRAHNPRLVLELQEFTMELRRITLLWEELWHGSLMQTHHDVSRRQQQLEEEIKRVHGNQNLTNQQKATLIKEKHIAIMKPVVFAMEQLSKITSQEPATPHEQWFQMSYGEAIKGAIEALQNPPDPTDHRSSWEPFKQLLQALQVRSQRRSAYVLRMDEISPALHRLKGSAVYMPGQTHFSGKIVTIDSVITEVNILPTKTKPKKLVFVGSDGQRYTYLFKGLEDLHLDERIMQFLSICNNMFARVDSHSSPLFCARHYSVTPLGPRSGLIQWVDGAVPVFALFKRWQQREVSAMALVKSAQGANQPPPQPMKPSELYYSKITPALKEKGITDMNNRRDWPLSVLRQALEDLMKETPSDLLAKELWCSSTSAAEWWQMTQSYARSTAVMSMIGYIIGLGDRHLDNMLVDFTTGEVVHIDYNVCFEKGKGLRVPEKVPFRMTPNLEMALGVTGVEGVFRLSCEEVLKILKQGRETLLTLLEAFVYDPLVDWTTANDTAFASAFYGGGATGVTDNKMNKKEMERGVTQSLFSSRVAEMKVTWTNNKDELLLGMNKLDEKLDAFLGSLKQLKSLDLSNEELKDQQETLQAAIGNSQHILHSVQAKFDEKKKLLADHDTVLQTITEKLNECQQWQAQHQAAMETVHGQKLASLLGELLQPFDLGLPSFAPAISFLKGAGQGHIVTQCEQLETELSGLLNQRRTMFRSCLDLLHTYATVTSRFPADYVKQNRSFQWQSWLQSLLEDSSTKKLVAKDRLSELTSREGDWFLDELCSMSGNVNQLLLLLKDYPMEVKEDQKSSQNRALNAMKAVMGVQKVFMALQELMTNFRMIIVPEAFKSIYAEDPSVFSVVQQLQAVASSQKMTLRKLVENLEARLLEGHEATEELDSKEVDAAVHEISVQFEKLLQTNKTSDSGEDSNNTMTSGQMLLAGFNGLFTKVASELSDMFTAFKQVHFGKHQLKFDFIRDAQELQLIDGTKNADLLGKLFYLKRLEVIISFFNSCRQSALSLKGVSSTGTKAGAVNCEAEPSNNLFVNVDSTSGETKIWNPDTCYSEDDLSVHVKHFIADCIQQCIMGLPSQALAAVIIPFASILGSKTEKESFDNNEKPVSLEEYCKKVVDSNLSCGLIKAKQLSHISGLASAYDVAWRKHDFARRLDNNMNIYKGVVQRSQLQLARFQWLYEDNLLQCPMRGNNMITPARATVMADLKKHVQGLIHMDSVVKGVEEKFGTQESSIEQRLKWAAGANPALNPVLQNFEQTLAARKKLLAVEGKHSSDICNLSNAILHCEALRTQTADAVGVDNVMTALVKRCQHSSAELESCSDKLQSVAEVAKKVKVSYPPEAPITLEWMKTKLDTVGQEITSVKTRKSQAFQAISSVRSEECSHLIKTIVAVCSGKVNDSRDNMEANVKEVKTMVKSIKSLVHWVHDHLLSLASPLVPDESGSSGGKTPIAAPPPTFASALRQGSNASTQASKDSVAPDIASPVHPVILQRDTSASPTGAGSPTASGRVLAVASPKRLSTANLARDPRTGKALQERNMYAIGVWRRVKSKLDGRDQDNNKKMSVADQVDFVIRESRSLDNLSQMYEGWTAWV
ncbi:PREDICTED: serine/threonine-protein kinase SMG1-like [Acropora digitifera]|uniref:serine/threonine-protein kinase SMG1-like n=1 Tax=Acropora digitifera TaxID=70779 RepID=UPI00077A3264|nr:PREDICTED: serine/threonine-protein kinase SMG1-like [Acropora digitifera]